MVSLATTTPTITAASITNEVLNECALATLSTRLGQQGEERAKDRCQFKELSQHITETSDQLAYIRKVLDHLISSQTLAPTADRGTHASSMSFGPAPPSGSGCLPPGKATSFPGTGIFLVSQASQFIAQLSTASGSVNTPISGNHISGQTALCHPHRFPPGKLGLSASHSNCGLPGPF